MAKEFNATIHGKETLSTAAENAVKSLNKLRSEITKVQNAAKVLAGAGAGAAVLHFLNASVQAYKNSEVAAAKLGGTILSGPAASLVALDKAFLGLKVASGEAFATAARPVIDWLVRVATDAASAGKQVKAAKEALDAIGKGEKISATTDAIAALTKQLQEVERAANPPLGRASQSAILQKRYANESALIKEQIRIIREAAVEQTTAAFDIARAKEFAIRQTEAEAKALAEAKRQSDNYNDSRKQTIEQSDSGASEAELNALQMIYEAQQRNTASTEELSAATVEYFNYLRADPFKQVIDSGEAYSDTLDGLGDKTEKLAEDTVDFSGVLASGIGAAFEAMGTAMVDAEAGFQGLAQAAFGTMAGIAEAYGQAALAAAIVKSGSLAFGPGALFAASAAAFVIAGVIRALSTKMTSFAEGGILNERVVGFGTQSGRPYEFGEAGPELFTPANRAGGMTIIQNYRIAGSVVRTDEMYRDSMRYQQRAQRTH